MPGALQGLVAKAKAKPEYAFGAVGAAAGLVVLIRKRSAAGGSSSPVPGTVIQPAATADTTASDTQSYLGSQLAALSNSFNQSFTALAQQIAAGQANPYTPTGGVPGPDGPNGPLAPPIPTVGPFITPYVPAATTIPPPAPNPPITAVVPPASSSPTLPPASVTSPSAPTPTPQPNVIVGPPPAGAVWDPAIGWHMPGSNQTVLSPQQTWLAPQP